MQQQAVSREDVFNGLIDNGIYAIRPAGGIRQDDVTNGYIVLHEGNKVTPYVVHRAYWLNDQIVFESGDYFEDRESAMQRFMTR